MSQSKYGMDFSVPWLVKRGNVITQVFGLVCRLITAKLCRSWNTRVMFVTRKGRETS